MAQYGIPFGLQIEHNKKDRQYISFVESTENSQIQTGGMFYLNPVKMDSLILNTLEDKYLLLPTNFNNLTPNDCTVKEYKNKDGSYYKKTVDCRKSLNNENIKSPIVRGGKSHMRQVGRASVNLRHVKLSKCQPLSCKLRLSAFFSVML